MWRLRLSTFENHRFGMVQLLPTDRWAHMLVPKMGGLNWISCSILFSVAEPVFHSSVEKHVCYTPPPGTLHPFLPPRSGLVERRDGVGESTMDGCGSRYSREHRLYHSGFLSPVQGRWHRAERALATGKLCTSRVPLNQAQKLGKYF